MSNLKKIVLVALLTALIFIMYGISMVVLAPFGPTGHTFSPAIAGILTGPIYYFMARKVGLPFQFTLVTLILQTIFSVMGGAYLTWFISSIVAAIIADLIASRSKQTKVYLIAIANGILWIGSTCGELIPANFYAKSFVEGWVARGQSREEMMGYVNALIGKFAFINILACFIGGVIGIYLGYLILKKHFKEA